MAIILAAGEGKRIGQTKWNLLLNGKTFLDIIVEKLIAVSIKDIVCVVREDSFPQDARINFTVNNKPECGMFSSIYCGVQKNLQALGYMIFPVDHPLVATKTLDKLYTTFVANLHKVICPSFQQKLGHPIIIPNHFAKKITFSDYPGGLRKFLLDQRSIICKTEVNDENILRNINTRSDI
ncbi:molybdenum cofactor cytidylyltransferase [Gammaproteobacteria bacterium]